MWKIEEALFYIKRTIDVSLEVQLAFQGIMTPMGVATYDNVKIQEIQEYLPTAEQIQQQIEIAEEEYKLTLQKKDSHEDA